MGLETCLLIGGILTSVALSTVCTVGDRSSSLWKFIHTSWLYNYARIYVQLENEKRGKKLVKYILENPTYEDEDKDYFIMINKDEFDVQQNRINEEQSRIKFNNNIVKIYPVLTLESGILGFNFWVKKYDLESFSKMIEEILN